MLPKMNFTQISKIPSPAFLSLPSSPHSHPIGSSRLHQRVPCATRSSETPSTHPEDPVARTAPAPPLPRRTLLSLGLATPLVSLTHAITNPGPAAAAAAAAEGKTKPSPPPRRPQLKSSASTHPALLSFTNSLDRPIKVYWVNYDADEELYAFLPPGAAWEVDTFETHPWRVRDAASNDVLVEIVASSSKEQAVNVTEELEGKDEDADVAFFEGFDGVGGREEDYGAAEISEIALDHLGGVALLSVSGFSAPVPLPVAGLEAAQLFHAAGIEFRRPTTIHAWARSLTAAGIKVERCLVTRVVGTTYYARVVIRMPGGGGSASLRSVDARPSDAVALAMTAEAPLFVSQKIARAAQPGSIEGMALRWEAEPPTGRMPAAATEEGTAPPPPALAGVNQA